MQHASRVSRKNPSLMPRVQPPQASEINIMYLLGAKPLPSRSILNVVNILHFSYTEYWWNAPTVQAIFFSQKNLQNRIEAFRLRWEQSW
jgi:hypothetical protein